MVRHIRQDELAPTGLCEARIDRRIQVVMGRYLRVGDRIEGEETCDYCT
jgi:hypothetical protein